MPITTVKQGMAEFKAGNMHSGKGGPVVTNPKQAVAISLNSAGKSRATPTMRKAAMSRMIHKYGG